MKKIINKLLALLMIVMLLTGCSASKQKEMTIEERIKEEIEFIEDGVFNITNKYAKGEYIKDDNSLDWNAILDDEKNINNILETIILDLSELDIKNDEILKLSNTINNLLIVTAAEKESEMLTELNNLYALIPGYLEKVNNKNEKQDKELKSMVLASYSLANSENWEEAKITIQSAIDKYNQMMNDVDYMQENSYKLNKTYILLGEVKNAIDTENINLVNLKFVNFIEKT